MKNLNKKGISLIIAIAIMLICSVLGVVMAQLLGVTSRGSVDYLRSAQAFGITQGGMNWYKMLLAGTSDWDTTTNQTGLTFGPGTFDVALSNKVAPYADSTTATRMDVNVTGKVAGSSGVTIQRMMVERILKLPSACKFALFWGRELGSTLTLTNTTIDGDFWSIGSTSIPGGSSVINGKAYRPSGENISGGVAYTEQPITYDVNFGYFGNNDATFSPTVSTPSFTTTYYSNLITTYTNMLSLGNSGRCSPSSGTITLNGSNNIVCNNDFNTNGNLTITGTGFIIAKRDILLHSENNDSGTLNIVPAGGPIVFISDDNFTVGGASNQTNQPVNVSANTRMFCRSNGDNDVMNIRNANTAISGALILANRQVIIQNGADVNGSTLFLADNGNSSANYVRITGSGTTIGTVANPSSVISLASSSGSPSALTIDASATAAGLFYQREASGTNGKTRINTATIRGTVIADGLQGNAITSSTITYDEQAITDPPPEGFNLFVTKKANSWSGN
ncbi:MAG: hypothetical protein MUC39_02905 [Candidatus Omnitrophica bacterium]|nr:hypothetical protein [Candidatus Omnitrophota bacterium]